MALADTRPFALSAQTLGAMALARSSAACVCASLLFALPLPNVIRPGRVSILTTVVKCHLPPRAVGIPLRFNSSASARREAKPAAPSSRMIEFKARARESAARLLANALCISRLLGEVSPLLAPLGHHGRFLMRGSVLKMCRGPDLLGHQVERGHSRASRYWATRRPRRQQARRLRQLARRTQVHRSDTPRFPQTQGESLRSSREDTTRVDAGRGDVETLSAFDLFGDGDDEALRAANDAREAALYPDGLLQWKRILQRLHFSVWHCDATGRYTGEGRQLAARWFDDCRASRATAPSRAARRERRSITPRG
jgi:hypothetical protein